MENKLFAAALGLALALTLSCGKDKAVENVKLLESITNDEGDVIEKFEYDDKNRLVKIYRGVDTTKIAYNSDDLVTVEEQRYNGTVIDTTKYVKKGNTITKESKYYPGTFNIDKDGYIVEEENSKIKYTYDDKKAPFLNSKTPKWLLQSELFRRYGYGVKNNILKIDENELDHLYQYYEYEYDSAGFAIKQTLVEGFEGGDFAMQQEIKHFIYSGRTAEEIAAFDAARQVVKKAADSTRAAAAAAEKAEKEAEKAADEAAAKYAKAEKDKALKEGRTFTDKRDGKIYRFVKIGEQTWMAENLNYAAEGSTCFGWGDNEDKCLIYGRLYYFGYYGTDNLCPEGWHLPSKEEWQTLVAFVGGEKVAGKKLKAKKGWRDNDKGKSGNGDDAFGFSALPGGGFFPAEGEGYFGNVGRAGYWWSSSKSGSDDYYTFGVSADNGSTYSGTSSSIRCVKDEEKISDTEL